jgi:hypothetical protein
LTPASATMQWRSSPPAHPARYYWTDEDEYVTAPYDPCAFLHQFKS